MRERREAQFVNGVTADYNWNKEKPKMQCTLEQLRGINWAYIARDWSRGGEQWRITPGEFIYECNLQIALSRVTCKRKANGSGWRFPNELDTGTMQELVSKCKLVDALIERELNKKWQPLPPMGCEFAYSVNGIIGIVNTDLEREVCQVGKFSALLANELIKRDGSKHIDAKRSMLTYQLEWPCEEVSQ